MIVPETEPCPVCGSDSLIPWVVTDSPYQSLSVTIACENNECDFELSDDSVLRLIMRWNQEVRK